MPAFAAARSRISARRDSGSRTRPVQRAGPGDGRRDRRDGSASARSIRRRSASSPSRILFFQMEPEFRSVTTASGTERTTTARYPVVFGAMPITAVVRHEPFGRRRCSIGRRRRRSTRRRSLDGGEASPMTTTYRIDGAMNDVRLAGGWIPDSWLRVGLGVHAHRGAQSRRPHADRSPTRCGSRRSPSRASSASAAARLRAVSSCFDERSSPSASARFGGSLQHVVRGHGAVTAARVPNQFGASLAYIGHRQLDDRDPHVARQLVVARRRSARPACTASTRGTRASAPTSPGRKLGAAYRLPARRISHPDACRSRRRAKTVNGEQLHRRDSAPHLPTDTCLTDLALIRASRTADLPASEHAWTLSFGITVRP